MSLSMWLCTGSTILAIDRPTTTVAATNLAAQSDTPEAVEMVPPTSHWPEVVISASMGLFALAAVIGPLVLAQSRRKAEYSQSLEETPGPGGRKTG
jgi:hypothetical protein